eukprot:2881371-Rhodomonas_salina.5
MALRVGVAVVEIFKTFIDLQARDAIDRYGPSCRASTCIAAVGILALRSRTGAPVPAVTFVHIGAGDAVAFPSLVAHTGLALAVDDAHLILTAWKSTIELVLTVVTAESWCTGSAGEAPDRVRALARFGVAVVDAFVAFEQVYAVQAIVRVYACRPLVRAAVKLQLTLIDVDATCAVNAAPAVITDTIETPNCVYASAAHVIAVVDTFRAFIHVGITSDSPRATLPPRVTIACEAAHGVATRGSDGIALVQSLRALVHVLASSRRRQGAHERQFDLAALLPPGPETLRGRIARHYNAVCLWRGEGPRHPLVLAFRLDSGHAKPSALAVWHAVQESLHVLLVSLRRDRRKLPALGQASSPSIVPR